MTLVVLSLVVIGVLIAALAAYLFVTGVLLNRVADNLDDCLQSVKTIGTQATPIGPGVIRLNKIGTDLTNVLPLLCEAAEGLPAPKQGGTPAAPPATGDVPVGVGYLDAPEEVSVAVPPVAGPVGVGYLDV